MADCDAVDTALCHGQGASPLAEFSCGHCSAALPAALAHLSLVEPGLGQPPSPSQQSQGPGWATTTPHVTGDT